MPRQKHHFLREIRNQDEWHRLGIGLLFQDPLMVEIGVLRCCFTNVEGIIGKPHMQSILIGFRIDCNRGDS